MRARPTADALVGSTPAGASAGSSPPTRPALGVRRAGAASAVRSADGATVPLDRFDGVVVESREVTERVGGSVDDERVTELAATLDDSVPPSKPARVDSVPDEQHVIGYTEEVVISGTSGTTTVVAKSDTGASRTSIDTSLAAEIGAGPIKSITKVRSGSQKQSKSRPLVDIVVGVGGSRHTVTASVEDRSHMNYPVILGRDILGSYQVDVSRLADSDGDAEIESEEEEEEGTEE